MDESCIAGSAGSRKLVRKESVDSDRWDRRLCGVELLDDSDCIYDRFRVALLECVDYRLGSSTRTPVTVRVGSRILLAAGPGLSPRTVAHVSKRGVSLCTSLCPSMPEPPRMRTRVTSRCFYGRDGGQRLHDLVASAASARARSAASAGAPHALRASSRLGRIRELDRRRSISAVSSVA